MSIKPLAAFVPSCGLYLIATPIGHRRDITLRALDVLAACDVVACEDTRVTGSLLSAYDIKKPLIRCDANTENQRINDIVGRLAEGQIVALCSDAGSPLISDPGYPLVNAVRAAGYLVTTIAGPSSVIAAVQLSGLIAQPFSFLGFVPTKGRAGFLEPWRDVPTTLVLFERATRLVDTVIAIRTTLGDRAIVLVREISKIYEEVIPIDDVVPDVKGECVLVIGPPTLVKKPSRNELYKQKLEAKKGSL